VNRLNRILALSLTVPLLGALAVQGAERSKAPREVASFGTLQAASADAVRAQALDWLKGVGKNDAASQKAFDAIWKTDRPVIDRLADTFALGDPAAAKLLADARDVSKPAPTNVPAILKDTNKPAFFRANLAVAYARALSQRRIYEEGLDALKTIKAEDVIDPAAYLFHKAVAEHALMLKPEAESTVLRLLDEAPDAPERYRTVGALMYFDMQNWQEKDLGWIARKMDNIERRLDLSRGGPKTQKMQKEVVARLDEIIKRLENQQSGCGS
jgi:hypothetical protein